MRCDESIFPRSESRASLAVEDEPALKAEISSRTEPSRLALASASRNDACRAQRSAGSTQDATLAADLRPAKVAAVVGEDLAMADGGMLHGGRSGRGVVEQLEHALDEVAEL